MKRTTKKLSGTSLERFFHRFFHAQTDIDDAQATKLVNAAKQVFSSVRVRPTGLHFVRAPILIDRSTPEALPSSEVVPHIPSTSAMPTAAPTKASVSTETGPPFDPYAFGLVPIFQRQGREGLLAQLKTIGSLDHLRKMARAQQIVLPADLRRGEPSVDAVREAILIAVEKRIADRRAAAS